MKPRHKLLSVLLSLAMCLSMLSAVAELNGIGDKETLLEAAREKLDGTTAAREELEKARTDAWDVANTAHQSAKAAVGAWEAAASAKGDLDTLQEVKITKEERI